MDHVFLTGQSYRVNGIKSSSVGEYTITDVKISHYHDGVPIGEVKWRGFLQFNSKYARVRTSGSFQINSPIAKDSTLINNK
jgi:hypothetical protein